MKKLLPILFAVLTIGTTSNAQTHEVGLSIGTANFLGDLGGANDIGAPFIKDLEWKLFKPAISGTYRYTFHPHMTLRGSLTWTQVAGDDALVDGDEYGTPHWFRNYRNLHFRTNIVEVGAMFEFNIVKYAIGSSRYRFAPYIATGINMFYFNPQAQYEGEWVDLQPLGTEGQGLPEFPDREKYSRFQPSIPIAGGIKLNIKKSWAFGLELNHRITFTDYLDDVSTSYPGDDVFYANYDPEQAAMVSALSRRSVEIDPENTHGITTSANQQRGDHTDNDHYFTFQASISYKIGNSSKINTGKYRW